MFQLFGFLLQCTMNVVRPGDGWHSTNTHTPSLQESPPLLPGLRLLVDVLCSFLHHVCLVMIIGQLQAGPKVRTAFSSC